MKLTDYFEAIINEANYNAPLTKSASLAQLQKLFPKAYISKALGVNASSTFGLSYFDKKVVIAGLKNNPLVKNVIHIPKNERANYPNMTSDFFKSTSEVFMVVFKNSDIIFFKDTSGSGKVNLREIPSVLSEKQLTPDKLGLAGKVHSRDELITFLKTYKFNPLIKKIIIMITKGISGSRLSSDNIDFDIKGLDEEMKKISDGDEARIFKDLGEVFSAIVSSGPQDKIFFPKESNYNLIDFIVERPSGKEKSYSAKFNEGARPSLVGVIANIQKNKAILKDDSEEKEVYEILKIINEKPAYEASMILSKKFKLESEIQKEMKAGLKQRNISMKDESAVKTAYIYVSSKYIKNYLNDGKTKSGSKIVSVFSSLMNASFNIDQVVIKQRSGDTISWKYYDFKTSRFQFDVKNAFEKYIGKISFSLIKSSLKK